VQKNNLNHRGHRGASRCTEQSRF